MLMWIRSIYGTQQYLDEIWFRKLIVKIYVLNFSRAIDIFNSANIIYRSKQSELNGPLTLFVHFCNTYSHSSKPN